MFNFEFEAYKQKKLQKFKCENTIEMNLLKYEILGYALLNSSYNYKVPNLIMPFEIDADSISSLEEFKNKIIENINKQYNDYNILGAYINVNAIYINDIMCGSACFSIDDMFINFKDYKLTKEDEENLLKAWNNEI